MSGSVHTVRLVYTAPTGYQDDRFDTIVVFTTEDRARLFVEWANREMKRINALYRNLRKCMTHERALSEITLPTALGYMFPEDGFGTDAYHFQYEDEFALDPMFG
jgi:hypothetical protein